MNADGRNLKRITHNFQDMEGKSMPTWAPNGRRIAYVWNWQIWVIDSNGDNRGMLTEKGCLLYTSPSPRDRTRSRMPSSA